MSLKFMQIKNLNNTAFSLLEILLASIIFIISIGGVFVTLNAMRAPVANKETALTAANIGQQVLEALRSQVNTTTYYNDPDCSTSFVCSDFSLALGTHTSPPPGLNLPSGFQLTYLVYCGDGTSGGTATCSSTGTNPDMARRVDLNVTWPDSP